MPGVIHIYSPEKVVADCPAAAAIAIGCSRGSKATRKTIRQVNAAPGCCWRSLLAAPQALPAAWLLSLLAAVGCTAPMLHVHTLRRSSAIPRHCAGSTVLRRSPTSLSADCRCVSGARIACVQRRGWRAVDGAQRPSAAGGADPCDNPHWIPGLGQDYPAQPHPLRGPWSQARRHPE